MLSHGSLGKSQPNGRMYLGERTILGIYIRIVRLRNKRVGKFEGLIVEISCINFYREDVN